MYSFFSYDGPATTNRRGRRTILVEYDCRRCDAQGDGPEQVDDGSNTDIYLNMSGDGIEAPSIQDDAAAEQDDTAGEQSANVHIKTILTCIENHIFI